MISRPISKQPRRIETIVLLSAWIIGNLWTYLWFIKSLRYTSQLNLLILGLGFTALVVQLIRSNLGSESWTLQFRLYPVLLMLGAEIRQLWSIGSVYASDNMAKRYNLSSYQCLSNSFFGGI